MATLTFQWKIDFENEARIWIENIMGEVEFHLRAGADSRGQYHEEYVMRNNNTKFTGIDKDIEVFATRIKNEDIIMDMGCGSTPKYGEEISGGGRVNVVLVDPLAFFYNRINEIYGYGKDKNRQCNFGLFEFISSFYNENYCDVILINNALDHCIDPFKSIIECLYVLKMNGVMRLVHRRAEGVFEKYSGFHKWNLDYNEENEFIIWNENCAVNISEQLFKIAEVKIQHSGECTLRRDSYLTVEITKKKDFELSQFKDLHQEAIYLAKMCSGLMQKYADSSIEFEKMLQTYDSKDNLLSRRLLE